MPWYVWFNDIGDIISVSKDNNAVLSKDYSYAIFTQAQVSILKDKSWSLFRVKEDKQSSTVHYLEAKPIDAGIVTTNDKFLTLIEPKKSKVYDIKVEISKNKFVVTAHGRILSKYENISPENYTASGKRELTFHFTSFNDPSFLIQTITIPLMGLITDKQISKIMDEDLTGCSIYTIKSVDTYIRAG